MVFPGVHFYAGYYFNKNFECMKQALLLSIFSLFIITSVPAQQKNEDKVKFNLKNNSWLPKKYTLISYEPGNTGNGTIGFYLFPGFSKSFTFMPGTKIYLADQKQVGVVMSGSRIDEGPPFRIITKEDNKKTFALPD
jgi:hypothetical protein